MQTLNEHQLSVLRQMPAFKELEAKRIAADQNAARLERVAMGLEPLSKIEPESKVS